MLLFFSYVTADTPLREKKKQFEVSTDLIITGPLKWAEEYFLRVSRAGGHLTDLKADFDWIGTLVILVVEIRFSTQQEVIWDFLLLLMSWLQWQQWHHWPTVTAVMCSACSFLTTQGEKRREWPCRGAGAAAASPQTYFTAKQALLIIYDWIVGMWTLCVMFSQLIRVSVAALILSRCFLTDGTEILLWCDLFPHLQILI